MDIVRQPPSPDRAAPWARPIEEVCAAQDVSIEAGLDEDEVARRRARSGPNRLRRVEPRGAMEIFFAQLRSVIVLLLTIGAIASFAFDQTAEGIAILAVIVLNALLGFVTELRAVRSMDALRALADVSSTVRRAGRLRRVPAGELVRGDVVLLEAGDVVTADLRVVDGSGLSADESTLTGESVPVDKGEDPVAADAPLAERTSMLFKGTTITRGAGEGVVVGIGMGTELGRISALVEEAEDQETPLERRLERLGRQLMVVSLAFVALTTGLGLARGQDVYLMVESAIALAVATVPEGLPVVATIALARGMWRMAKKNALVERLSAVETLGSTSLILSDKTGTLTENRLRAARLFIDPGSLRLDRDALERVDGDPTSDAVRALAELAIRVGVEASEATVPSEGQPAVGDPLEIALVALGARFGMGRDELLRDEPELREIAFDQDRKMSATEHRLDDHVRVAVKGAPEAVLAASTAVMTLEGPRPLDERARRRWADANERAAADGLRVIALAHKEVPVELEESEVYSELVLLGLVGLSDPPRSPVRAALDAARSAGVRVVMVTGDQPATAFALARALGLVKGAAKPLHGDEVPIDDGDPESMERALRAQVVARASPEQKLRLLSLHQRAGEVVAVLGDGVNDAPALRQADIGVAMGRRGTQVARQAADMVLEDDELSTVVLAIEQGRVIFTNLRAFVVYLLGCNLAEILAIGLAAAIGWPLPILPLQILYLNLLTDVFPAVALAVGEGDPRVMRRPPRARGEPFLARRHWTAIVLHGVTLTAAVLGAFGLARSVLDLGDPAGVTVAFATLGFSQLWHVFDMADPAASPLRNDVTRNPWVWAAVALCTLAMVAGLAMPGLAPLLGVVPLPISGWLVALALSLAPLALVQLARAVRRGRGDPSDARRPD